MLDWSAEIEVSEPLARALIEDQLEPLRGRAVRRLAEGWDNAVFAVGDDLLFRFPRRKLALPGVEREIACLGSLAALLPVAIPVPRWIGRPGAAFPFPFFGFHPVAGLEACELALTADERARLAPALGRALAALHAPAVVDAIGAALPADPMGRLDLQRRLPWGNDRLDALARAGESLDDAALRGFLAGAAALPRPAASSVVHGDLHFRHWLVDPTSHCLTGIIDWGDLQRSDPAVDLQLYWSFLPHAARPAFEAAYGPIPEHRKILARAVATYLNATLLEYGLRDRLAPVIREARTALHLITTGEPPR